MGVLCPFGPSRTALRQVDRAALLNEGKFLVLDSTTHMKGALLNRTGIEFADTPVGSPEGSDENDSRDGDVDEVDEAYEEGVEENGDDQIDAKDGDGEYKQPTELMEVEDVDEDQRNVRESKQEDTFSSFQGSRKRSAPQMVAKQSDTPTMPTSPSFTLPTLLQTQRFQPHL
ncbi:hypothetical protein K504DRAFT_518304 [Pleomassaria siparia CBS 279.74]|uniref:Uncharacterized protein n=1 Tax=Pleomassaria siparia CBS 279.74 TaxID=1314801 RepID=A0A6G1KP40_9PLEO|nr:hypothetical protein K504DRAFT_518304 [Pleomassaria siparia CBS 279.74]